MHPPIEMKLVSPETPILLAVGLSIAMLAGCAVGPNYSRPTVPAQAAWKEGEATTNANVLPPEWWHIFNDAELNSLEGQAVKANQDLALALARVAEGRALARGAAADLYPNISSRGAYSRNHLSENLVRVPNQDLD